MLLVISGVCCCLASMASGQTFYQDLAAQYGHGQRPDKRSLAGGFGGGGGGGDGWNGIQPGGGAGLARRFVEIREAPPKRIEARQHGKIVLECSADGEPAPHITWLKDGRPFFKVSTHTAEVFRAG